MITIESAWHAQGYTRCDHLLDDAPLANLIGTEYRSVGEARRALNRRSNETQVPQCRLAPVCFTVRLASGVIREIGV